LERFKPVELLNKIAQQEAVEKPQLMRATNADPSALGSG
jgi:hypothetical protein